MLLGRAGENVAASFFERNGYRIIARNWHCRFGEIDLIVRRGCEWRFVEVKTRMSSKYGFPEEAITASKLRRQHAAISCYLSRLTDRKAEVHGDVFTISLDAEPIQHRWLKDCL